METLGNDPDGASEPFVSTQNQENRVSTKGEEEFEEEPWRSQPEVEQLEESGKTTPQGIISLQRDLSALPTNIYTAFIAKELLRRRELEEAQRLRMEQVENDAKSSQAKLEEIKRRWSNEGIPQELQKALNSQQQLCNAIIEDKKKLINDLQQELKARDDRFVKDVRKQAEELDLTIERMEEQIKTLTMACREELSQMERVYMLKSEVLITKDKTDWEQYTRELCHKELERLTQWEEKVEEYETIIHNLMLDSIEKRSNAEVEGNAKFQVLERQHQNIKGSTMLTKLKKIRSKYQMGVHEFTLTDMKNRARSLKIEIKNLMQKCINEKKLFMMKKQQLSEGYKCDIQQYEHMQKKIRHFSAANARKFKEMWLMLDAELKQLAERALVIDSQICHHLGLSWQQPHIGFMVHHNPIQAASLPPRNPGCLISLPETAASQLFQTGQALQCSEGSVDTDAESNSIKIYKEATAVQSESGAEVEGGTLPMETLKKVMKLLCNEVGFLMEDKQLELLATLEEEEQAVVTAGSLISSLGIKEDDLPKLAHLLKHQRQQTEDVCGELGASSDLAEAAKTSSTTNLTSDLIHCNRVLPALKGFPEQHVKSRESPAHQQSSLLYFEAWDSSEKQAYWKSMGNIIPEDKIRLWEAAENIFKQYLAVLTDISDLIPETESLKQQNRELRMLLQKSLNSIVSTETEKS